MENQNQTNFFLVSKYCKRCQKKGEPKQNCKACLNRICEVNSLNKYVERMNEKYKTDCPKIKIT